MESCKSGNRDMMENEYSALEENSFCDYQLLEMLLSYSVPRADTKLLAKDLLNRFGSLDNLMNADIHQITLSEGVKEDTALLIKLAADIGRRALSNKENLPAVKGMNQAAERFEKLLGNEPVENFAVMLTDGDNKVQFCGIIGEGTANAANVTMMKLTHLVSDYKATALIIAHNHPNGIAEPSGADVNTTLSIRDFMKQLGVTLVDHIIIGSNGAYSMSSDLKYNHYFSNK